MLPKIDSFTQTLEESQADVCICTETWTHSNAQTEEFLGDFSSNTNYDILRRDRGSRGGGVAIVFNKKRLTASRVSTPPSEYEVLAAIIRRTSQRRKILCIAAYIPPNYDAEKTTGCIEYLANVINLLRAKYDSPYIVLGGDFNMKPVHNATKEVTGLKLLDSPPTRGNRALDRLATNFNGLLCETARLDPIENIMGVQSDHLPLLMEFDMPKVPSYTYKVYSYVRREKDGDSKFCDWARQKDWSAVHEAVSAEDKAIALTSALEEGMNASYNTVNMKRKSSEPPWMTEALREKIRIRRAVFRKYGRNHVWKKLKKETVAWVARRKKGYFDNLKGNLLDGNVQNFYTYVRAIHGQDKPEQWTPRKIRPHQTDKETAEEMAAFFCRISNQYSPLDMNDIPTVPEKPLPIISEQQVQKLLLEARKTKSMVPGDIFSGLYSLCPKELSRPITSLFNAMSREERWIDSWKREVVTVIPKTRSPSDWNECRNISCTAFLSKVYERHVLQLAREEVTLSTNQYGGEKNCGVDHFLVDIMDDITEILEDKRASAVISSLDYSKAFNRLSHLACLQALARKGMTSGLLNTIASFLNGRKMTVKLGNVYSEPTLINAGAPQGSVLGSFLFNVSIDHLEKDLPVSPPDVGHTIEHSPLSDMGGAQSTPAKVAPSEPDQDMPSPIVRRDGDRDVRFLPRAVNVPNWVRQPRDPHWRMHNIVTRKYIDDGLSIEKINMSAQATLIEEDGTVFKCPLAVQSQHLLEHVNVRAGEIGMVVNATKTAIMAVSAATSYEARAFLNDPVSGEPINSKKTLKILGFIIDQDGGISSQLEKVKGTFRRRVWLLREAKKAGMTQEELIRTYKTYVRPTVEVNSVVMQPMLTADQSQSLERQQSLALRLIYGHGISAEKMRQMAGIERLEVRRIQACETFTKKALENPRFEHWFTRRQKPRYEKRTGVTYRKYEELTARTDRRMNTPKFNLRRIANRLQL